MLPLEQMKEEMDNIWSKVSEQTLRLQRLCRQNGFESTKNKKAYEVIELGQTGALQSLNQITQGEISHIENIAKLFIEENNDSGELNLKHTDFTGGKFTQNVTAFPMPNFFNGKTKRDIKNFRLSRLDWSVGTYIESLRFTMSDGQISSKMGGKTLTDSCEISKPINKIVVKYRERGIVSLEMFTESETILIAGNGEEKHTDVIQIHEGQDLVQFKVRLANGLVQGICFGTNNMYR